MAATRFTKPQWSQLNTWGEVRWPTVGKINKSLDIKK